MKERRILMSTEQRITRREFLEKSALVAAGAGFSTTALPAFGRTPHVRRANERIHIGVIGVGGMGTGHLRDLVQRQADPAQNIRVMAVCDVWDKRRLNAARIAGLAEGDSYRDYRRLLERKDVDAILTATPDHWHAKISMDAMDAGKHVYCEKPMTLTWQQARDFARKAAETKRVVQIGVQSTSDDRFHKAHEVIRSGGIGKVLWSQTSYARNNPGGEWNYPIDPSANPHNLDWDMWLGHRFGLARKRPWDPDRYFRFRKYWDYSGGIATDLFYHQLAHLEVALGPEFPVRVSAGGGRFIHRDDREVPDTFYMTVDYPSGHSVIIASSMNNHTGLPEIIRGQKADLTFEGKGVRITPQEPFKEEIKPYEVAETPRPGHKDNWFECIRSGNLNTHCNPELGYKVMVAIHLAVLAYRTGKTMHFNPDTEEVSEKPTVTF